MTDMPVLRFMVGFALLTFGLNQCSNPVELRRGAFMSRCMSAGIAAGISQHPNLLPEAIARRCGDAWLEDARRPGTPLR